jgi:hypothetical protein
MNVEISKNKNDFVKVLIDIETLEAIAKANGCHYNNLDWWEVSQYIKNLCLSKLK